MKEEKFNNSIRQKLDGLSSLPEDLAFHQQRIWEELETALQPAKPKRKMIWFPWAAVFVIVIGTFIFFSLSKKQKSVVQNTAPKNIELKEKPSQLNTKENNASDPAIHNNNSVLKNRALVQDVKKEIPTQQIIPAATIDTTTLTAIALPPKEINTPVIQKAIVQSMPAAIAPKKTKLKEIHLNELYEPQPILLTKTELKRRQEEQSEKDAPAAEPAKNWWQPKPKQVNISFTDNQ